MNLSDPCSDSSCKSELPGCRGKKCADEAGDARSYDAFINKCAQCESGSRATQNCMMAVMQWCESNCDDPTCAREVAACKKPNPEPPTNLCPNGKPRVAGRCPDDKCPDGSEPVNGQCPDPNKDKEVQQARAECQAEADKSVGACDPDALDLGGGNGRTPPSINEQCEAYRNGSRLAAQATSQALNQCLSATNACKAKCEGGAKKYSSHPASQEMTNRARSCNALFAGARAAADQGNKLLSAAELADRCRQITGSTPSPGSRPQSRDNRATGRPDGTSPGGGGPGGGLPGGSPAPYGQNSYMGASGQTQQPLEAQPPPSGTGGFREPEDETSPKDFNVASQKTQMPGLKQNSDEGPKGGPAVQVKPIGGGGGGGGFPGADGGAPQAKLGARPGFNGQSQVSTDVLQGFQGGGGYFAASAGNSGSEGSGSAGRGRAGSRQVAGAQRGLDLRQYLPGGDMDNSRRAGGFRNTNAVDIHGQHVNFWHKISGRIQEKCRLGLLFDCR